MSEIQQKVSAQFLEAMGSMIEDKEKVQRVLSFIKIMRSAVPCQMSSDTVREYAMQSYQDALAGKGMLHEDVKTFVESWRR